jgi:hypothetical protein
VGWGGTRYAELEDAVDLAWENKDARKKMNATAQRALASMKQRVRRQHAPFEKDLEAFRAAPWETEDSADERATATAAAAAAAAAAADADEDEEDEDGQGEDDDDGFTKAESKKSKRRSARGGAWPPTTTTKQLCCCVALEVSPTDALCGVHLQRGRTKPMRSFRRMWSVSLTT